MIITMRGDSTSANQQLVIHHLQERGYQTHTLSGGGDVVIGVNGRPVVNGLVEEVADLPGVRMVNESKKPYMLAQREARPEGTVVIVGNVRIGTGTPVIMAGPCVVEARRCCVAERSSRAPPPTPSRGLVKRD
jgi:3-deoxy-7-phosphoheptulonate synthase